MKIVSIIGARPQFIKCAPLSHKLRSNYSETLIHTGQHYDKNMSDIFFDELNIPKPDYNLGIGSNTHGVQTGKMLSEIEMILLNEKPNIVIVYGDTNSTLAGALAASKLNIKIAHIEAGLRSFDRTMPEEINRILTDQISDLLFCPTETATINLNREGMNNGIYNVGDIMMDALFYNKKISEKVSTIVEDINLTPKHYMLATIHRASNTDNYNNLLPIVKAFCDTDKEIVFPVHPRTEKYLKKYNLWDYLCQYVNVIKPVGYLDMLKLMNNANKILTDSGGIQKEAYMLDVPCITLRDNTEWLETVDDGWNILVGSSYPNILKAIDYFTPYKKKGNIFGSEGISEKIYNLIESSIKS